MTEDEKATTNTLVNPAAAVTLTEEALKQRQPASTKEDWVLLNANLMKSIGAAVWLGDLLDVLSQPESDYNGHDIVNPTLAVNVSNKLQGNNPPLVARDEWIKANVKLINELGSAEWLWKLLDVLETSSAPKD
jgi:hypothetical protein